MLWFCRITGEGEAMGRGLLLWVLAACLAAVATEACAQPAPVASAKPNASLRSRPETVVWGYFSATATPVLRIKSGDTVKIDTVSHQGLTTKDDPATFFGAAGIPPGQVLADAQDIYHTVPRVNGMGAHVLSGPIAIENAIPGDMLEVRVIGFEYRVPYGVNNVAPGTGVLPDLAKTASPKVIKIDTRRGVALLPGSIELKLAPFLGIMAVAPPQGQSMVSSRPPAAWGGNMDFRQLTAGSTLYLPVFATGALFYTGDSHALQGDGEVDGTALELSLTAILQFVLHKGEGAAMHWPRAEDAKNYYAMGMDVDLNLAMKNAVQETVDFITRKSGLSPEDAYRVASLGVDFRVAEAVDYVQVIYGVIPKRLFKQNPPYWARR
jgi:acetamidase/formamidase